MGGIRENIKASGVVGVLVAGEPYIALFRNQTDQKRNDGGDAQAKGSEQHKPVLEGIGYPDTFRRCFSGRAERYRLPQLQGIEKHSIEVPGCQAQGNVGCEFLLMAVKPGAALLSQLVFQLFQELGWTAHQSHLLFL